MAVAMLACCGGLQADEVRSTLISAQTQFQQSHYEQALKLYKQAQDQAGTDASIEYNMGLCHLQLGDGDKALQHFEGVASQADADAAVRRKAFFNIGVIRAEAARLQLQKLQSPEAEEDSEAPPVPVDDPQNITELEGIADELLRSITLFRECEKLAPGDDARHNLRAVRITRRNVLGLLHSAMEAKEKEDMLNDPAAYLEALIGQQRTADGLSRHLLLNEPASARAQRQARRAILRLQREIMDQTGTLADHLAQFVESAEQDQASGGDAPAQTPREQVYHAVAAQLEESIEAQRDASAFLMEADLAAGHDQQLAALDQMYVALHLFPQDPQQALAKARNRQAALMELVSLIESQTDWLQDPLLGQVQIPENAELQPARSALHYDQTQLFAGVSALWMRLQILAAGPSSAEQTGPINQDTASRVPPQVYRQLADLLKGVGGLRVPCLDAITAKDQDTTLAAQQQVLDLIDAALEMLPKSIEQRIAELVEQQARLNEIVKAEAGDDPLEDPQGGGAAAEALSKLAAEARAEVLGGPPSEVGEAVRGTQDDIHRETQAVHEDLRQQISSSGPDAGAAPGPPAGDGQSQQVQAYIEASKHVEQAGFEMLVALEGLDKVIVQNDLGPMEREGPVQTSQAKALDELLKALAALRPPQDQPQDEQQDQQQQQQQEQQDESGEDARRAVEREDQEREEAERELYQRRPRTVIKDW